ncbi:MAG: hypothetical protein V1818_01375 [Candidatus Aenigmatarchaeota archaeon]
MSNKVIADFGNSWNITEKDLQISYCNHEFEREFIGIRKPLELEMVFPTIAFTILSAAQNTPKLVKVFSKLKKYELLNHENILEPRNIEKTYKILKGTRFPNTKIRRFTNLPLWWGKEESKRLLGNIIEDIQYGGKNSLELRNELAGKGPLGVSNKAASFVIQLLTEDTKDVKVVTVDTHMTKFLKDMGYTNKKGEEIKIPDGRKVSGMSKGDYLKYEKNIMNEAERFGLGPGELQYALWCKKTGIVYGTCLKNYF